jgi:polar amino acid transport system substrate-binding protein
LPLPLLMLALLGAAGCGDDDDEGGEESAVSASAEDCTPDKLQTEEPGTLTVATDDPAFPPYFVDNDPTNGKGFESAVAYAIADQLGYQRDQVKWVVEAFNSSYAPGPKDFTSTSTRSRSRPSAPSRSTSPRPTTRRSRRFVALKDSEAANASSLEEVKDATIGVQIDTTSLDAVNSEIQPDSDPKVFDTSNDVVQALKQGQVDAVVVDVPTAFFLTAVQVPARSTRS